MLTFLRKVRRSLIQTGSTQKYFLYAIGEIALVVIGILIALQINNWNQSRINIVREERVLKDILNEIESNVKRVDYILAKKEEIVRNCTIFLSHTSESPTWPSNLNFDSLIVMTIVSGWSYNPENGVLTDVLSSGKLELIRQDSIRYMISSIPALTNQLQYEDGIVKDDLHNHFIPFMMEKCPIRNTHIIQSGDLATEEAKVLSEVGRSNFKGDQNALLRDPEFENNLIVQMMWVSYSISAYKNLRNTYVRIIEGVNDLLVNESK